MARYIDADELIRLIEIDALCNKPYSKRDALACVKAINTADVVPRAELDAMRGAANSYKMHYENAKIEVAREIFEEIDRMIFGTIIPNDCAIISIAMLAELKKKYIPEVCTDCKHFVGCECFSGQTCDMFEQKEREG